MVMEAALKPLHVGSVEVIEISRWHHRDHANSTGRFIIFCLLPHSVYANSNICDKKCRLCLPQSEQLSWGDGACF